MRAQGTTMLYLPGEIKKGRRIMRHFEALERTLSVKHPGVIRTIPFLFWQKKVQKSNCLNQLSTYYPMPLYENWTVRTGTETPIIPCRHLPAIKENRGKQSPGGYIKKDIEEGQ